MRRFFLRTNNACKKIIEFYALTFSVHASGSKESLARRSKADGISDNAKRLLLLLLVGVDALRPTQQFFQQQVYEIDLHKDTLIEKKIIKTGASLILGWDLNRTVAWETLTCSSVFLSLSKVYDLINMIRYTQSRTRRIAASHHVLHCLIHV